MKKFWKLTVFLTLALVLIAGIAINSGMLKARASHKHDFVNGKHVPARCEAVGAIQCGLAGCEDIMEIPPLGHDFVNATLAQDATCTAPGFVQCSRCDVRITVPAKGHAAGSWIVNQAAGCEAPGHAYTSCEDCGIQLYEQSIPATGHALGDFVISKAAACMDPGEKYRPCLNCGKRLSIEAIPATGHTFVTVVQKPATATTEGLAYVMCSGCGEIVSSHPTPPTIYIK